MRELIREFVRICSETLPIPEPVYEFGSFRVPGQENLADLRPLFPGKKYIGVDMRKGLGVDIVLDLHRISLPAKSVGTAISMDTFEHVEYPRKAMEQIYRVMQPNGIVIIASVMLCKIHDYPGDYWRFTPECFRSLLKLFPNSFVSYAGVEHFPHTVIGIGLNGDKPPLENFEKACKNWQVRWSHEEGKLPVSLLEKWRRKIKKSCRKRWNYVVHARERSASNF